MPGLGDFLQNMFQPQPMAQQPGQAFQDPMQGMGPMQRFGYLRQNNPESLMSLAAGLMKGDMGAGFAAAGDAMGQHRREFADRQENQRKGNATKRLLVSRGYSEDDAQTIMDSGLAGSYLGKAGQGQGIINAGAGNLYNSETGEWLSAPGGGVQSKAGLMPVWLRDETTGQPVLGQMRQDGTVVRSGMPDGTQAIGPYDVNFDKAAGSAAGKGTGEASVALPGVQQMAGKVQQQVEDLKNDPYLSRMLGPIDSRLPNVSQDSARVQSKIAQLTGEAFLSARQALKGGGAITDYEGQKAEAALARLNQAQSEEDFKAALDEFNYHVQLGMHLLQQQAGKQRMDQGTIPPPGGSMREKYGLD